MVEFPENMIPSLSNHSVFVSLYSLLSYFALQIPTDLHPATKKSALETVLTVDLLFIPSVIHCRISYSFLVADA